MKTFFVIPAYNEEKMIGSVISNLKKAGFKNIVVVDDGSADNTFKELKRAKIFALQHIVNRGQGAAIQTGIEYALEKGADIIVTYDADGQHQIKDVKKMIPLIGKYDVVLGSRFLKGSGKIPFHRKVLLKGSVVLQRVLWNIPLTDAHNGLRVFSRKAASMINITSDKMEHASQISEQIVNSGLKYKEVPVSILYTDYSLDKGAGSLAGGFKIVGQYLVRKLFR